MPMVLSARITVTINKPLHINCRGELCSPANKHKEFQRANAVRPYRLFSTHTKRVDDIRLYNGLFYFWVDINKSPAGAPRRPYKLMHNGFVHCCGVSIYVENAGRCGHRPLQIAFNTYKCRDGHHSPETIVKMTVRRKVGEICCNERKSVL